MSMEKTKKSLTWERGQLLGKGSYGYVFFGMSSEGKPLAVKSAKYRDSGSLQKERIILEQFHDCSEILTCYGYDVSIGSDFECVYDLFLEYAPGGSLSDLIKRSGGRIPEKDVGKYTRMILRGLSFIHKMGYVHCDLKPDNILVFPSDDGVKLKIADFGISKEPGVEDGDWKNIFRGTPLYMSPESIADGRVDCSLDIWSLGCIIIEMITGRWAWQVDTNDLYLKLCYMREAPEIPYYVSEKGKDFLHKCFEVNPDKRWTASMLLNHPFVQEEIKRVQLSDCLRSWLEAGDLAEDYWNRFDRQKPKRLTRNDHRRKNKCLVRLNMNNLGTAA